VGWHYFPSIHRARRISFTVLDTSPIGTESIWPVEIVANSDGSKLFAVDEGGKRVVVFSRNKTTGALKYRVQLDFETVHDVEQRIAPLRRHWRSDRAADLPFTIRSVCPGPGER